MRDIVGDSFGQVTALRLQDQEQRNRMFALAQQQYMQGAGMAQQRSALDWQHQFEQQQAAARMDMAQRELALRQQSGLVEAARYASQAQLGRDYVNLYNRQLQFQEGQGSPQQQRQRALDEQWANRQAEMGNFDDLHHVLKVYPWMSESQAGLLADRSLDVRNGVTEDFNRAKNAADTLNARDKANKALSDALQIHKAKSLDDLTPGKWSSQSTRDAYDSVKQLSEKAGLLNQKALAIQNDKKLSALTTYDPDSSSYLPAVPAPRWTKQVQETAPEGFEPTSGKLNGVQWYKPAARSMANVMPTSTGGTGTSTPVSPAPTSTGTYAPRNDPIIHQRTAELIGSGMAPIDAAKQAVREYQDAQAGGGLP